MFYDCGMGDEILHFTCRLLKQRYEKGLVRQNVL